MDTLGLTFHDLIAAVCPITGVRIVDPTNVSTWIFWPDPSATQTQIAAGQQAQAAIVLPLNPRIIPSSAFQGRFTQAEQQAVWRAMGADTTGALGAAYTMAMTNGSVNLTDAMTSAFVNGLVAAGALTSARATAILTP